MKDLIIVGAGGFGREALSLAKRINNKTQQWNILGFIDDNLSALENVECTHSIIGTIADWQPNSNQIFVLAIANPITKERVVTNLKKREFRFVSLISPTALISDYVTIGEGCVITGYSSVGDNVNIGDFVHIAGSMIGQESIIGDYSTTTGFVNIASAYIGKRVFVGSHSVILNNVCVGDDAFVCAGSIVLRKVKEGIKVFGNPAKKIEI